MCHTAKCIHVGKATVLVNASTLSMHHIGEAMNHVGQLMLPNRTDQRMLPNRTDQQHTKTHQNTPTTHQQHTLKKAPAPPSAKSCDAVAEKEPEELTPLRSKVKCQKIQKLTGIGRPLACMGHPGALTLSAEEGTVTRAHQGGTVT